MEKVSTFAARLKIYRDINNLTLEDLENVAKVPAQTLNRYELGQRTPKVDKAGEIAETLGVNPLWLQGYDVSMTLNNESKNKPINGMYLRLAREAENLGLDEEDINTIITLYAKHKKRNG